MSGTGTGLSPLPSRERWIWLGWIVVCPAPHLWIADQARNDVTMLGIVFTLTFDSSPIKGEGDMVGLDCCLPCHPVDSRLRGNDGPELVLSRCHPHLALWFPAYAGMTVMRCGIDGVPHPVDCGSSPQ